MVEINQALNNLIICHLQKTAGNTFVNILHESGIPKNGIHYDKLDSLNLDGYFLRNEPITATYADDLGRFPIICGHFHASKYAHTKRDMVTWVRDPIERTISHYYFYKDKRGGMEMFPDILDFAKVFVNYTSYVIDVDLSRFKFIGISDHFDESMDKFAKVFDIRLTSSSDKLTEKQRNINDIKPVVSEEVREELRKYLDKDYELYNKALEIFKGY